MRAPGISTTAPASRPGGAALGDVGVLAVVPERWGGMWLSRHQILTRLTRYFEVVWFNPARSLRRALAAPPSRSEDPAPPPERSFAVYDPEPWLPKLYRPHGLAVATERERLRRARRMLERAGCSHIVLYLWQYKYAAARTRVEHDASVYHIVDEYSFSDVEQPLSATERDLIEHVDQVIVHSPALREKKGMINPNTAYVTNGVDYPTFAAPRPEPADLAAVPHPRIGYVGRLKRQLDWEALGQVARSRPGWSVVLVGPLGSMDGRESDRDEVLKLANVHYLGNRSVTEIPAYIQHMDVCLLCYALTDYTRYIFPLKLHEYLATGRPVVGSDIRSLREFEHVVRIVRDPADWCTAIEHALSPEENTDARCDERRRTAQAYDWNLLTKRIAGLICDRLGGEYPRRFAALAGEETP